MLFSKYQTSRKQHIAHRPATSNEQNIAMHVVKKNPILSLISFSANYWNDRVNVSDPGQHNYLPRRYPPACCNAAMLRVQRDTAFYTNRSIERLTAPSHDNNIY